MRLEDTIKNFLRKLKFTGSIADDLYKSLNVTGSAPGILYGLPKIHKLNFRELDQFRPIFAAYNAPTYKLSKYLVKSLAPLTINEHIVDNSDSFSKAVSKFFNAHSFYMISTGVDNLFTNVPSSETISIYHNLIFANINSFLENTRPVFKKKKSEFSVMT